MGVGLTITIKNMYKGKLIHYCLTDSDLLVRLTLLLTTTQKHWMGMFISKHVTSVGIKLATTSDYLCLS